MIMNIPMDLVATKSDTVVDEFECKEALREYLHLRSLLVDLFNPRFKMWNEEFDSSYSDSGQILYDAFIKEKQQSFVDRVNPLANHIELFIDENCDIAYRLKKDPEMEYRLTVE